MGVKKKAEIKTKGKNKTILYVGALLLVAGIFLTMLNSSKEDGSNNSNTANVVSEVVSGTDLVILKSDISSTVKFYPYKVDNVYMEVMAVKAKDGTIRTALNTCQVCYGSGKGYYIQSGDKVICQNCGNSFSIDAIEKQKNGCNPIPVNPLNKKEEAENIVIARTFMEQNKNLFTKWRR